MKTITIQDDAKTPTSELIATLKKKYGVWSYWDDKDLDQSFPVPASPTSRQFALEQEASAMKGSSWDDMAPIREQMMTLREYIIFFQAYHEETGGYPDEIGWTILRDSLPDGGVADVDWNPGYSEVRFIWDSAVNRDANGGCRMAISLNTSPSIPSLEAAIERVKKEGYVIYKPI